MSRLGLTLFLAAMTFTSALAAPVTVEVREIAPGRFELWRDGRPYFVRGAGGMDRLDRLATAGANSLRTWGTDQTERVIDAAARYGLTVCVGLWVAHSREGEGHGFDYADAAAVRAQIERHCRVVDRYKDHPALLLWGVGNELDAGAGNDPRAWDTVEAIAAYIRRVDPRHPVMTVTTHPSAATIAAIRQRCPSVRILGVNTYAGAGELARHVRERGWLGPYLVTEWGNDGGWEVAKTPWGAELEPTSTEKARQRALRYAAIVSDRERCLGSYAFFWGQKQETTPTWFNFFTADGAEEESVGLLQTLWTGKPPAVLSPSVGPMRLNAEASKADSPVALRVSAGTKTADTRVAPRGVCVAELALVRGESAQVRAVWELMPESVHKGSGGDAEKVPAALPLPDARTVTDGGTLRFTFTAPAAPGAYRLFVYVHGEARTVATANLPFLVE